MFDLRTYIKKGLLDAVGKMADYQVIMSSLGWMEKNVLTQDDLAEIQAAIEEYHRREEEEAARKAAEAEELARLAAEDETISDMV